MTAKPQPMAGQSDASDDLIAELAKLMAQDAQGDRPAQASRPVVPVRIPGGDAPVAPAPRFDFERSSAASGDAPVVAASSPVPRPAAMPEAPEPFHFDFDLNAAKPSSVGATSAASAPADVKPDISDAPADHDSIADLIAAELSAEQPVLETPPEPAPAPAVAASPRPAAPSVSAPSVSTGTPDGALRQPNLQPPASPEQDRFKVAPVFGLASQPASTIDRTVSTSPAVTIPTASSSTSAFAWQQPTPAVSTNTAPATDDDGMGRDPIDEIESLIGSAMRVELDRSAPPSPAPERPAPSPALRSLATPTIPVPSDSAGQSPRALSGADEAILAAAEATGVQIGWVDAPEAETETAAAPRRRGPRGIGMTRAFAGPLVAITLLLAAGFGLYWVLGLGSEPGPAPLLTADASPVKETPAAQPEAAAAQQSVVFNEIDGVVPGAEEQLVSRDQADVNEVTQIPAATDLSEEGLANRKVRTVTVRPDGTIVSGDDSVAGSTILPVDRPNVPAVPGAATASPELQASVEPEAAAVTPAVPEATVSPEPAVTPVTPVTPGATVPAVDAAGNPLAGKTAVIPMTRPAGLSGPGISAAAPTSPVNAVVSPPASGGNVLPPPPANNTLGSVTAPAAAAPAAATASAAPAALPQAIEVDALPNDAPAYVQLASQRSEADARASAQAMVTRFGPLFGGANLEVQRVDLGERGIYYRVRVPANSLQEANSICTNVKAAGGDCFTM
ncbi:MAG: SPOR domain-containing protein [Alphaproteobacteria bacterium]|nr:SPOR domain-containing protein [Alphaproteobacteria bacterium]MBU1561374.1 SPOR domain-containing protein [Alphaproteobacteria bacterium]MBU2302494.1 SPOR domain-containing protein [Alphaproteobacteria bacterium]MBU2367482.1 SPOR domain-containing protein [Alphaproteobacteria bacterium]